MKKFLLCLTLFGCSPHMTDEEAKGAADLAAKQQACVQIAKTVQESHECRCEQMKLYGRACPAGWERKP